MEILGGITAAGAAGALFWLFWRLRRFARAMPGLFIHCDSQGRVIFASRQACEKLGIVPQDSFLLKCTPKDRSQMQEILAREDPQEVLANAVFEFIDRDGKTFFAEVNVWPRAAAKTSCLLLHDVTDGLASQEKLYRMANYDALTDLPNRAFFLTLLEQAFVRAQRQKKRLAILYADLDRFKQINDSLGHDAGDEYLKEMAKRMRSCVRASDTLARLGGDEYALFIEGLGQAQEAAAVAEKIISAVSSPFFLKGELTHPSISVGIAIFPDGAVSAQALLHQADKAMYAAKNAGGNCWRFHEEEFEQEARRHLDSELAMKKALASRCFSLHYQPLVDPVTGEIKAIEALLRWPVESSILLPQDFLPLAEETGQIVPLGGWVLEEALLALSRWKNKGLAGVRIAVNVSEKQLSGEILERQVKWAIEHSGLCGQDLILEFAQAAFLKALAYPGLIAEFKAMGVSLALDGFGTGRSSLAYLKSLPISFLKFDRDFIKHVPEGTEETVLARDFASIARIVGMEVVAEGVETQGQWDFFAKEGALAQGNWLSPPLDALSIESWLEKKGFFGQPQKTRRSS